MTFTVVAQLNLINAQFVMSYIVVCAPSMYSCLSPPSFRYRTGGAEVRTGQFCPQGYGRLLQTDPISRETAQEHEAGKRWPAEGTTSTAASHKQCLSLQIWQRCIVCCMHLFNFHWLEWQPLQYNKWLKCSINKFYINKQVGMKVCKIIIIHFNRILIKYLFFICIKCNRLFYYYN